MRDRLINVDRITIQQVIGCLMRNPSLVAQTEKYNLSVEDFAGIFERSVFSAINLLYDNGARVIDPINIYDAIQTNGTAQTAYENNHGTEYLNDAKEFAQLDNFDYYYQKLKKFNLLRDLQKQNFDTSIFYSEFESDAAAAKINQAFESLTVEDICKKIRKTYSGLENKYLRNGEVEIESVEEGYQTFLKEIEAEPNIGAPVQGKLYNQIINGAERKTLTIRAGSSGVSKTRSAMADACFLAYPIRYDSTLNEWVKTGGTEKVLFIITEQTMRQAREMIMAYLTDINSDRFRYGNTLTPGERERIKQAELILKQYNNLILMKVPNPTISSLQALIRDQVLLEDFSVVFYDYIFISPELLGEFKGNNLRNDEILLMMSNALKNLAVELNIAIFTSTQVNANADDNRDIRNESSLAGGRATINKADNGAILSRPKTDEIKVLRQLINSHGGIDPNIVTDVFKVRSGRFSQVRVWSYIDLGTLKKEDLFVTDALLNPINDIVEDKYYNANVGLTDDEIVKMSELLDILNSEKKEVAANGD